MRRVSTTHHIILTLYNNKLKTTATNFCTSDRHNVGAIWGVRVRACGIFGALSQKYRRAIVGKCKPQKYCDQIRCLQSLFVHCVCILLLRALLFVLCIH